jgi:hypothetical protein
VAWFVFARRISTREILDSVRIDADAMTEKELSDDVERRTLEFDRRYPGEDYEVIRGSGTTLDAFLQNFPEYQPPGWRPGRT